MTKKLFFIKVINCSFKVLMCKEHLLCIQHSSTVASVSTHLLPPEVVDHHHAGQVQHHAQSMEGGHSKPQSTILLRQAGRVVLAVGAAVVARQALTGHVRGLVSV